MKNFDPSFPFYVNDWLSSPTTRMMSLAECGAYVELLAYCWQSQTVSLPNDPKKLAAISRLGDDWHGPSGERVRECFIDHPTMPGMLTNDKLMQIWQERANFRKAKSKAGKLGSKRRWNKTERTVQIDEHNRPIAVPY